MIEVIRAETDNSNVASLTLSTRKRLKSHLLVSLLGGLALSCVSVPSDAAKKDAANNQPSHQANTPVDRIDRPMDVPGLCAKLKEIKSIPYDRFERTGDPIHDGLLSAGNSAILCLIEKITDAEKTAHEYVIPEAPDFRVGDAAVFMLFAITGAQWEPSEMFPPKYAKMYETEGMFAYFAYVEKPENRKRIQEWWERWYAQNLK